MNVKLLHISQRLLADYFELNQTQLLTGAFVHSKDFFKKLIFEVGLAYKKGQIELPEKGVFFNKNRPDTE